MAEMDPGSPAQAPTPTAPPLPAEAGGGATPSPAASAPRTRASSPRSGRLAAAAERLVTESDPDARAAAQPAETPAPPAPPTTENPEELFEKLGRLAGEEQIDTWLRRNPQHPVAKRAQAWASRSVQEAQQREKDQQEARERAESALQDEKTWWETLRDRYLDPDADDDRRITAAGNIDQRLEREARMLALMHDKTLAPELEERATERLVTYARHHPYWASYPEQLWQQATSKAADPADVFARAAEARVQWAIAQTEQRLTREWEERVRTAVDAATKAERDRLVGSLPKPDRDDTQAPRRLGRNPLDLSTDELFLEAFGGGRRNGS